MQNRIAMDALEPRRLLASVPAGFVDETVISGTSGALALSVLPDGRWLVAEQPGKVKVVKNGQLLTTPALSLGVQWFSERGLLGMEIDPDFATNRHVYLFYTPSGGTANRISRFTMSGDTISPASEVVLFNLSPFSTAGNHNGGALHFGNDGKLYATTGDNANPANAQRLDTLHGKMLRLNRDGSIPSDNPFYTTLSGDYRAIWAYGLRNPFTFAIHPITGRMHINDVGQDAYEEINLGRAGANYGWPGSEGPTTNPAYDAPIYSYGRSQGEVITGGVFYAGTQQQFPASYANDYFFADYDFGYIKALDSVTQQPYAFATGVPQVLDLELLPDGSLLYLSRAGTIGRITYQPGQPATITGQPADLNLPSGQKATFTVQASGEQPVRYQWYRNNEPIDGATGASYSIDSVDAEDHSALFKVRVENDHGSEFSRSAKLSVSATNTAPRPEILSPTAGATFFGGQIVHFTGSARDDEDPVLPASAFAWKIEYITGDVVRPFQEFAGVTGGSFDVPTVTPYTAPDVQFRITLTVTDGQGASGSTTRELLPRTSTIQLSTSGATIPLLVDGQPKTTPVSIVSVQGVQRTLEAPQTYVVDGVTWTFQNWSDNGARSRTISTPANTLTLVAHYAAPASGTTLQSESALLLSGTSKQTQWKGYTGTGYADYGGQNSAVEYAISRASAGAASLTFRYANGAAANRPLQIRVNNVVVGTVVCAPTGGWDKWQTVTLASVSLPAGNVKIRAIASTSTGGANVDSLTVSGATTTQPPPAPPPPPSTTSELVLQSETGTLSSGTSKQTQWKGYTGTGYADYGGSGSAVQYSFNQASSGTVALRFRYANGSAGNRPLQILVNNTLVGTLSFGPTGGWDKWSTTTLSNITLPSGTITLRAVAQSAGGANIDSLTVIG